jgi:hypothetical protein
MHACCMSATRLIDIRGLISSLGIAKTSYKQLIVSMNQNTAKQIETIFILKRDEIRF